MSQRSGVSADSALPPQAPASDDEIYQYALRVAYLAYLVQTTHSSTSDAKVPEGKALARASDSWTSAFASMGDIFKADSKASKEVRFPKDFVKIFGQRIESVAKGSDIVFTDSLFRSTVGAFYGSYNAPTLQKQLKENRKVEELIITFVSTASAVLKKRIQGDEWKNHLMSQVGYFVRLINDTLKPIKSVPTELTDRLAVYIERLGPPMPSPVDAPGSENNASMSAIAHSPLSFDLIRQVALIFRVREEQLKRDITAIRKFCTEKAALRDLKTCMGLVHQGARFPGRREDFDNDDAYATWRKSELETLQQLIMLLAVQNKEVLQSDVSDGTRPMSRPYSLPGPARPTSTSAPIPSTSSFRSSIGATSISTNEYLSGGIADMRLSASLAYSSGPNSAHSSDESRIDFTFVPLDPQTCYVRLLELALGHDLDIVKAMAADEEVSLRILSPQSQELLVECALRWRLMLPFRAVAFIDEIARRYSNDEIPIIQCVTEALADVDRIEEEWQYDRWAVIDVRGRLKHSVKDLNTLQRLRFVRLMSDLFDTFLRRLYEGIASPENTSNEEAAALEEAAQLVASNPVFAEDVHDLSERLEELQRAIRGVAIHRFEELRLRAAAARSAEEHISELMRLCDWLESTTAILKRRFKDRLLDRVDVVALYIGETAPLLAADLHASKNAVEAMLAERPDETTETRALRERDVRELFQSARAIVNLHQAVCPRTPLHIDFGAFEPWVRGWLMATDAKTLDWVHSAVSVDKFAPEGPERHSSSIVDLIDSCKAAVAFVQDLRWPDRKVNAIFLTQLSQTISKAIEEYCAKIEQLFNSEMFIRTAEDPEVDERTSAWLIKAKGLYAGDKKAQPFVFTPASLVKLNNIQAARDLLDKMYSAIDADNVADILRGTTAVTRNESKPDRYLFTVKVILGEQLVAKKESSKLDPFLTLSDAKGRRVAKTRTLYDTPDPRWSETFDLSVQGSMWLAATVYDRKLMDEHDLLGRAYIHLDPKAYGDFLAHDLWLKLDTHGRLLLRISMEGEKDDIQFYFGRAFRSLKRTEADMIRVIVDKMSPFIRQFLSRTVVRSLVKKGFNLDLALHLENMRIRDMNVNLSLKDIKLDRLRNMFSSSQNEIPPIAEIPPVPERFALKSAPLEDVAITPAKRRNAELTDSQIEDAIGLLFEYFEETLATLKGTLSDPAFANVMNKIWKEILSTIEGLLVPPLSDQPAQLKPLSDKEVYIVIRWLKGLLSFFHADGCGVSLEDLQNPRYHALISLPLYYDMGTDELEMECARAINQLLAAATGAGGPALATLRRVKRSKSVYSQRNLGTIRQRKREKQQQDKGKDYRGTAEMMMRILRMRPSTQEFLSQQQTTLKRIDQETSRPPPLQRSRNDVQQRPQPTRISTGGHLATGTRSAGAMNRPHTPIQLVDKPMSST